MAKKTKSESGLFEILKVTKAKSEFDSTEVDIRIPKFQNFGLGLAELERQADEYEKKLEAAMTPEDRAKEEAETDAVLKDSANTFRNMAAEAKKEFESLPNNDPMKEMKRMLIESMEEAAAAMENPEDDEESEAQELPARKASKPEDFELFTVLIDEGLKWDDQAEKRLDEFIQSWPETRPLLLKKAHAYYKELYPELKEIFGDMPSFKFTMPEPTAPEAIEDIFSIGTIYLRDDGTIGISGSCTWDDEHGFGAVINNGKVVTFGHADEGFCS